MILESKWASALIRVPALFRAPRLTLALVPALTAAFLVGGCDAPDTPPPPTPESSPALEAAQADEGSRALAPEQEAFWAALLAHCGNAYEGEVSDVTPYYADGVVGRRAVIHFLDCSEDRIHVPFHLDDNHSRNWIVTRVGGTLRLKHDHRNPDGTEEAISQYGGDAPVPGLATRQIFPADGHTAEILPDRADNFWFLDFIDEQTLQYGVHWPRLGHSVRFSFDLSRTVETPPHPWGYEPDRMDPEDPR
jgi:hypothetical protein